LETGRSYAFDAVEAGVASSHKIADRQNLFQSAV
jgi:hypothetical protein